MVDIQSPTAENRRGKKKEETTAAKYNGLPYWVAIIITVVYLHQVKCFRLYVR